MNCQGVLLSLKKTCYNMPLSSNIIIMHYPNTLPQSVGASL